MTDPLDLRLVRPSTFESTLGSEFVILDPETHLRLTDVTAHEIQENAPRREPFTLTFVGPAGLEQRIYELEHAALGRLSLFLVPVGYAPDGGVRYEAVFN